MPELRQRMAVFLGLLASVASAAASADEIPWSPDRRLTWADFAGPVARNTAPEDVAVTAASLGWSYDYVLEFSGEACRYRVTDITASAMFDRNRSWSKPEHRTAAVLAHEQGHFDITQVHRLLFEAATRDHVGVTGPCDGSGRRAARQITAAIEARVGPIYESIWQRHNEVQAGYDRDTGHGTDAAVQAEWSRRIAESLRDRSPDALALN